jgi:hypothetical protein
MTQPGKHFSIAGKMSVGAYSERHLFGIKQYNQKVHRRNAWRLALCMKEPQESPLLMGVHIPKKNMYSQSRYSPCTQERATATV